MTESKTLLRLEQILKRSAFSMADDYVYYKSIEPLFKHPRRAFIDISKCNNHYVELEIVNTFNAKTLLKRKVRFLNVDGLVQTLNKIFKEEIKNLP